MSESLRRPDHPMILSLVAVLLLGSAPALAKSSVVVLNFGGKGGNVARRVVTSIVQKRYDVIPGKRLLAACDELGIRFSKGKNLARAAAHIEAVAVIGGKVAGRRLNIAVFSGVHGRPVVSTAFAWGRRPPKPSVRRLIKVLFGVLAKEARRSRRKRHSKSKVMAFKPDPVTKSSSDSESPLEKEDKSLSFEPEAVGKSGGDASTADAVKDDDPPDLRFTPDGAGGGGGGGAGVPDEALEKDIESGGDQRPPRVIGLVGVGIWSRSFSFNQAAPEQTHSEYSSGAAFALHLELRSWPLAFLTDNFLANIFLHYQFQMALGLSTRPPSGTDGAFSTTMWEMVFDGGYSWNLLDTPKSPIIDIGMGGGLLSFSVSLGENNAEIFDVGYPFLLFGVGGRYPIVRAVSETPDPLWRDLELEVRFDYRVVFSAGQVAEEDWYGPASQGGLSASVGGSWRYKQIVVSLLYTYTRYFLDFDDGVYKERLDAGKLSSGGALDQFHGVMLSGGYSF